MSQKEPVDVCYVINATQSMNSIFSEVVDLVSDISFDLLTNYRKPEFTFGGVVYRDPIDYKPSPQSSQENDSNKERNQKYDREAFPFDRNVSIQLNKDFESLATELEKVECGGGNDNAGDWVGALNCALHDMNWRENSKKAIIWLTDSNAHGKKYCGFDNHNEEEEKLDRLTQKMAEQKFHFIGINIVSNENKDGCKKTLYEMKNIYEHFNGPSFNELMLSKVGFSSSDISSNIRGIIDN